MTSQLDRCSFIQPDDGGNDVLVHTSAVERAGLSSAPEDYKLSFVLERGAPSGKIPPGSSRAFSLATEWAAKRFALPPFAFPGGPLGSSGRIGAPLRIIADIGDHASLRTMILQLITRHFDVGNDVVTARTRVFVELSDCGFGSLELTMALEDAFDLEIPDAAQAELHTVDDVTDYIAGRLGLLRDPRPFKEALSCSSS